MKSLDENRVEILSNFIENLDFEGFSAENLQKSTQTLNLPQGYETVAFPGGVSEIASLIAVRADSLAEELFLKFSDEKSIRTRASRLMHCKLLAYHQIFSAEGFKKFVAFCAHPSNLQYAMQNIWSFASKSWYTLGDTATDYNYYTKRLSFSAIYSKSALYSISDNSADLQNTLKFIETSIDGLIKFGSYKRKINDKISELGKVFSKFTKFKI